MKKRGKFTNIRKKLKLIFNLYRGGDILCEMRFYVPNMEETESQQERKYIKEQKDADGGDGEKSDNSEEEATPAKIFNDQIL